MRYPLLAVVVLLLSSSACQSGLDKSRELSGQSKSRKEMSVAEYKRSLDPCQDSLFLALQHEPYDSLTAFEHAYFQMVFDECYGTPNVSHSGPAEWIVAIPVIAGAAIWLLAVLLGAFK